MTRAYSFRAPRNLQAGLAERPERPPTFSGSTQEITIGAKVFDRSTDMPATVRNLCGPLTIELERPTVYV